MRIRFEDLEDRDGFFNGKSFTDASQLIALLEELSHSRPPFMCELIGDNGVSLTVGISRDIGCAQYAPSDGTPPYLMAVDPSMGESKPTEMEFSVGGTGTPIDGRYCLDFPIVKQIVGEFIETGER